MPDRLDAIQARLDAITRPPWVAYGAGVNGIAPQVVSEGARNGKAPLVGAFAKIEDAQFVAHSPEDIEWLIQELLSARSGSSRQWPSR